MKPPRVLHITPMLFGENGLYGGAERYSFELARHMAAVAPTTLVSFGNRPLRFNTTGGLRVNVLGPALHIGGQRFNPIHHGIIRAVAEADIIHCFQPCTFVAEFCALLGRLCGRHVVASDLGGGGWSLGSRIKTDRWFRNHLHISQYSRRLAGHEDRADADVIYGGVDVRRFSPDLGVQREPMAVFVGRLMPHKGIDDLIKALPSGMTLELIGRPYHKRFYSELRHLADGKQVVFSLNATDDDIIHAYRRSACVVLPSVYRDCYGAETSVPELLGQTLLEGMACGTAGLCTNVASLPEVVADGVTGYIVPPNSPEALRTKLEWFRDNPQKALAMGDAGRYRVLEHFIWPTVVKRCLAAYHANL